VAETPSAALRTRPALRRGGVFMPFFPFDEAKMSHRTPTRGRGRPIAPARLDDFLLNLAETADVATAAERSGLHRSSLYRLRATRPAFLRRWDEALHLGTERLQDKAMRHALQGVERPVWYAGQQVGTATQHDHRLLQFLLKAHRPEIYDRDRAAPAAPPFDLIKRMAAAEKRMAVYEKPAKKPAKKREPRRG